MYNLETIFLSRQVLFELKTNELKIHELKIIYLQYLRKVKMWREADILLLLLWQISSNNQYWSEENVGKSHHIFTWILN